MDKQTIKQLLSDIETLTYRVEQFGDHGSQAELEMLRNKLRRYQLDNIRRRARVKVVA